MVRHPTRFFRQVLEGGVEDDIFDVATGDLKLAPQPFEVEIFAARRRAREMLAPDRHSSLWE